MDLESRNTQFRALLRTFERQCARSDGVLNEEIEQTVNQVLQLLRADREEDTDDARDFEAQAAWECTEPAEYQAAMDVEIVAVLKAKLLELDQLANSRELREHDVTARTSIIGLLAEIEGKSADKWGAGEGVDGSRSWSWGRPARNGEMTFTITVVS